MTHRIVARLVVGFMVVLPGLLAGSAPAAQTVRVDVAGGAPRLVVDGQPVRARIFWGAPGMVPLPVTGAGGPVAFDFSPAQDEPGRATMHFRFGPSPGDVDLADIRVVDTTTGQDVIPAADWTGGTAVFRRDWVTWPPDKQNTVATVGVAPGQGPAVAAGLHIALAEPAHSPWPDFHIYHQANLALHKGHRYHVSFWARANPPRGLTVAFYRPGQTYTFLGGPPGVLEPQIKLAAAAGVNLVSFPVNLPWPKPGDKVDWSAAEADCQRVLEANAGALLLPRIEMDPPTWWRGAHPDDVMVWDQGPAAHDGVVIASPAYRQDAAARLAALVEHLEEKFGPHIAGYHPVGQNTGEWFYQNTWERPLNGYAPGDLRAWQQWLVARYHDDAALQSAWHDPAATRAHAAVPTPAARRASPAGALRDPAREQALIDFAQFQQEAMAQCVCDLAHAVRQATHGRKLILFFYGYVFEFGLIANGPATAGHYALRRVLDCPDIDVLCSPISYFDRGLGQSAAAMTAAESVALAGKMWLYEDDTRTYLGTEKVPGWEAGAATLEQTQQLLLRNTAQCAVRNFATWWMDLGASGWFNDPRLWEQMKRLDALDQPLLRTPRAFLPEVAAVIDPQSVQRVTPAGQPVTAALIYEVRRPLGRLGAPYGQYLSDDVEAGRVHAKMYVFLTAWCAAAEQRRQMLAATRGRLRVWCYAPGWQDENGESLAAMQELTGFALKRVSSVSAAAQPTALGRQLGLHTTIGPTRAIEPLFAAADATADEILATYGDGSAAVALRKTKDGPSLFVGPPGLTSELLRLAARQAGVHLFTQSDCNVYANGPYMVLHAAQDGVLEIDTGRGGATRDLLTGKPVGAGPRISLDLKMGDTQVLEVGE